MSEPGSSLFNDRGWRLPRPNHRTFSNAPKWFYRTTDKAPDDSVAVDRILRHLATRSEDVAIRRDAVLERLATLKSELQGDALLSPLLRGVHVPFVLPRLSGTGVGVNDIGALMEERFLPAVSASFVETHPGRHFKAVLQDQTSLGQKLSTVAASRYQALADAAATRPICGLYFPQALQEYDVDSQVAQMGELPARAGLALSGPLEVSAALVGFPELLFNDDAYSPVLCLSAVQHADPRLVCCFKSYGPHLEFWCMSQMLVPGVKQVSEQWSGGLTVFAPATM